MKAPISMLGPGTSPVDREPVKTRIPPNNILAVNLHWQTMTNKEGID